MSLNERYLNFSKPFIDAMKSVFETMIFSKLTIQNPRPKSNSTSAGDISTIMGLAGEVKINDAMEDFNGLFVISFPEATYLKVASAMLMEEYTEITEEIHDVGGEISNIATGNAKRYLAEMGYAIKMATPTTIIGKGAKLKYPPKTNVIEMDAVCDHGPFSIEICYKDHS